jgi:hypothetical protein
MNVSRIQRKGREGVTHSLFKKALNDRRIHHFILIHLSDFVPNDILRETLH